MVKRGGIPRARRKPFRARLACGTSIGLIAGLGTLSQTALAEPPTYSTFGTMGLIDMPTAASAPDAELATTVSRGMGQTRTTLSFQISDRLSGSFRYAKIDGFLSGDEDLYDRSFDLQYRLMDEGTHRPALAIGMRDFIGTGIYSSEYLVATKTLNPSLRATGGIGWGRLGSAGGFTNPLGVLTNKFETRPPNDFGVGGSVDFDRFFRGDAALFGGIEWDVSPKVTVKAELSSDGYEEESTRGLVSLKSPLNVGMTYRMRGGSVLSAQVLHGAEVGVGLTIPINPKNPPSGMIHRGPAPQPVALRPMNTYGDQWDTNWTNIPGAKSRARAKLEPLLTSEGIVIEGLTLTATSATLKMRNLRYGAEPQAIGRAARALSRAMPNSVETFVIIPVVQGIPVSRVVVKRSDMEALEHDPDGAWKSYARARISDASDAQPSDGFDYEGHYPRFSWAIGPYASASYFDPDDPIRFDIGVQARARYEIKPGLVATGGVRKKLYGSLDESMRPSDSVLPHVRSDANIYAREGDPALTDLTLSYSFRPGRNLYGRVVGGYLEQMYGGAAAELLWKPVDSRLALGVELAAVQQRDFDGGFGFRDYETITGHASAYYDFGNGYHGQLDVGRYLAEDWGTTIALDREFANGWSIGAYATFTDVSSDDFGEGSFDKGLRFNIPLTWLTGGQPSRREFASVIQPVTRDGGARVQINDRLYQNVRNYHDPELGKEWGTFWQ